MGSDPSQGGTRGEAHPMNAVAVITDGAVASPQQLSLG
jgi:hypothetical protein